MTCRTGPLGVSTCGRVALPVICAPTGATAITPAAVAIATACHDVVFPRLHFIEGSPKVRLKPDTTYGPSDHFERLQRPRTRAYLVLLDAEQMQDAQQHV